MTITRWLRPYRVFILLFILAAFVLRIPILRVRFFDPDEFQHLHGARQIYRGQIPYRDYFEHHTPLLHFILARLYPIFGEEIRILFAARALMMVFTAAILCLTCILAKMLYGIDAGLFATLFLSYAVMFLEKSIEVRPDLPAVAFWLASLIFMVKGIRRSAVSSSPQLTTETQRHGEESKEQRAEGKEQEEKRKPYNPSSGLYANSYPPCPYDSVVSSSPTPCYILSGLMMGIAIMFTQKALFALAGLIIALIWMLFFLSSHPATRNRRTGISMKHSLKLIAVFLGAMMVPIILVCGYFYAHRGLWQFINCNFIMNSRWKMKFWPFEYIKRMLSQNPFFPVISVLGLLIATTRIYKTEEVVSGNFAPVLCTYALLAGLFVMPVPYRQYYLLFLPLLAIYCGFILRRVTEVDIRRLISNIWNVRTRPLSVGLAILAANLVIAGLMYTLRLGKPAVLNSRTLYLILWSSVIALAVPAFIFRKSAYAALIISIGIIAYPLNQTVNQLSEKNSNQLASVEHIMDITSEEDSVLDGWSGFGVLRSHAYYYFFLHPEMRAMLNQKELSGDLIKSVEEKRAKIIIYDSSIKALPGEVQRYIKSRYVPSGHGNIYIRHQ